jgi:hypothetical protein
VVASASFHYGGIAFEVSRHGVFDGVRASDHDRLDAVGAKSADGSGAHAAAEDEATVGEQFDDAVVVMRSLMLAMMLSVVVPALTLGVRRVVVGAKLAPVEVLAFNIKNHESHASPEMLREQSSIRGCNCYFHLNPSSRNKCDSY